MKDCSRRFLLRGKQLPVQFRRFHVLALAALLPAFLFSAPGHAQTVQDGPITGISDKEATLRSYADSLHFWLGTTFQGRYWYNAKYKHILATHFNSGVSIIMFPMTQPKPGEFDFGGMDRDMSFAKAHDMKLFGVALVYRPGGGPDWFKEQCGTWSKDKMDQVLKDQIHTVVRHGGDMFYGWEVVNEPTNPSHNGCWSQVLGQDESIARAFRYAREAAPNAQLLLNDTFGHDGIDKARAREFFDIIRRLKSSGVPVDVAGIEMHLHADVLRASYIDGFKWFLTQAKEVGVQVQITEMDVTLPRGGSLPDFLQKQKDIFYNVLHTCLTDPNCTGFTTWGTGDNMRYAHSLEVSADEFSAEKPLWFDDNLDPKPAFAGVLQALKEGR
jgi:endo-1,4-beta-xylanase